MKLFEEDLKPGYYRVLKDFLPAVTTWTCGDGCCSGPEYDNPCEEYAVGTIIYVDADSLGDATYQIGSDYEGFRHENYRPMVNVDYIKDGFLEPVDGPTA